MSSQLHPPLTLINGVQIFLHLMVLFSPLVIWDRISTINHKSTFLENFIWLLITIKTSALITLWFGLFNQVFFTVVFVLVVFVITYLRDFRDSHYQPDEFRISYALLGATLFSITIFQYSTLIDVPNGGDALSYHLPMATQWVQSQNFLAQDSRLWFYPGGYELLTAVFFLITQNDLLWFLPDLFALTLLMLSVHGALTSFGINYMASSFVGGALVLTPLISRTIGTGDNDLWVAALTVATVYLLLQSIEDRNQDKQALGLICVGALVGAKHSALPLVLLLPLFFCLFKPKLLLKNRQRNMIAFAVTGFLALSFPVRNFLITGNPFFPTGLGDLVAWGDTSHIVATSTAISPEQIASSALIRHDLDVWQVFVHNFVNEAPFLLPLITFVLASFVLKRSNFNGTRAQLFVLSSSLLTFVIFVMQPLVVENVPGTLNQISSGWSLRFALSWFVLLTIFLFTKIPQKYSTNISILLFLFTLYARDIWIQGLVLAVLFTSFVFVQKYSQLKGKHLVLFFPFLLTATVILHQDNRTKQVMNSYTYGGQSRIASILSRTKCSHVIVASTSLRSYPLVGFNFKHRVHSVGMSLPAEHFVESALSNEADMLIISIESGDPRSPTFGKFPVETQRIPLLLDRSWNSVYQDDFIIVYAKEPLALDCSASLTPESDT